ncbi:P-loop containing nucleoside triphosphate hydrolases superfamily protein isoform X4 [Tasmannia lanceolata]|uniref:P-loop containing nucleoside triphosphate hydrolases superfamily protein isoform X4 n=1 Tax=Tasmannia lanceolata TaxID=3420 RepID=UPI0040643660
MATAALGRRVGAAVKEAAAKEGWGWFTPHMAATSRAILDRIPMVDFTLEIRDSRIPFSSAYEYGCRFPSSSKRMIVLNKIDLADRAQTLARIRELKVGQSNYTATVMLAGIPNVGKSAIANSLHQIGRISAAEKGKLKHAVVTPLPGETKDISSFKIASHPNIYVLDTPGVLAPEIFDIEMGSKLALTGAVQDWLTGECELAKYFLSILNSSDEYKRWEKLNTKEDDRLSMNHEDKVLSSSNSDKRRRKQYSTDHTQDFIVRAVRRTLFETVLSFTGNMENEEEMVGLIKAQLMALHEAFRLPLDSGEDGHKRVATKLLNLYRTGRLGHYTLDPVPVTAQESII